jgi:hypothetical protein
MEVVLLDHAPGPDQVEQLALGDDPVAPLEQREQEVERACAIAAGSPAIVSWRSGTASSKRSKR